MERKQMEVDSIIVGNEELIDKEGTKMQPQIKMPSSLSKARNRVKKNEPSKILEMNRESLLQGIIFSEILGTPRARRKR